MAEMGLIGDRRCADALDYLERLELANGGWAALGSFYRVSNSASVNASQGSLSPVVWGRVGANHMNEWVTADTLFVLHAARRA